MDGFRGFSEGVANDRSHLVDFSEGLSTDSFRFCSVLFSLLKEQTLLSIDGEARCMRGEFSERGGGTGDKVSLLSSPIPMISPNG